MKLTAERPEDTLTGDELAVLREGAHVTQAKLAGLCAVAPNTIARAERNELTLSASVRRLVAYALAEHLRVSVRSIRERITGRRDRWKQVHVNYDALRQQAAAASEARFAELGGRRTTRKAKHR